MANRIPTQIVAMNTQERERLTGLMALCETAADVKEVLRDGYWYAVNGRRVELSEPLRKRIATLRKDGVQPGEIGNQTLAAGWPSVVASACVNYARAIKNVEKVNEYWAA